jgi:lipoprotein NlpI
VLLLESNAVPVDVALRQAGRLDAGPIIEELYDVVLDVAANAVGVFYGIILEGSGRTWIDGVTLEPVGTDVPSTNMANPFTEYFEGRYGEAARVFADAIKNSPDNYMACLFYALALHRSGRPEEARTFLAGITGMFPVQKWAGPVVQLYAGRLSEDEVLKAAASADPKTDKEQRCEAYYYLAMAYLLKLGGVQEEARSNASKAQEYLEKCVATGVTTFVEYQAAQAELGRLKR